VFTLETDADGSGCWAAVKTFAVPPAGLVADVSALAGEWARLRPSDRVRGVTAWFEYAGVDARTAASDDAAYPSRAKARLLITAANPSVLTLATDDRTAFELDATLKLTPASPLVASETWASTHFTSGVVTDDGASLVYVDDQGRTWRFPKAAASCPAAYGRVCREVCTERDLFAAGGTFFELPAGHSGGFAKTRAVASPKRPIADYASWRGLLVLAFEGGAKAAFAPKTVETPVAGLSLWLGATDDIWKLGKPTGVGGPWKNTLVRAGEASDAYLANGYDRKKVLLTSALATTITLEADPNGEGSWYPVESCPLAAGETRTLELSASFNASWLRVRSSADTIATATFVYE